MNAGPALYIAGKAPDIMGGIELAAEIIDSGKAAEKLRDLAEASNE